jgi:hypothetical protein
MDTPPDFTSLKNRQQAAWGSGDATVIGTTLRGGGESLAVACDFHWDDQVCRGPAIRWCRSARKRSGKAAPSHEHRR